MSKLPNLTYWANKYALEYWNREIEHEIKWNKRLKIVLGQVVYQRNDDGFEILRIDISPDVLMDQDDNFHETLKHELCHYFLLLDGISHDEYDEVFINELKRVGGALPFINRGYEISCGCCGAYVYTGKSLIWDKFAKKKTCSCPELRAKKYPIIERIE